MDVSAKGERDNLQKIGFLRRGADVSLEGWFFVVLHLTLSDGTWSSPTSCGFSGMREGTTMGYSNRHCGRLMRPPPVGSLASELLYIHSHSSEPPS